jgi:aspartate oxidase
MGRSRSHPEPARITDSRYKGRFAVLRSGSREWGRGGRQCTDLAMLDIAQTPTEVPPPAGYSIGEVWVEADTHSTDVEGLYAIGECATGLHGADRMGDNSLVRRLRARRPRDAGVRARAARDARRTTARTSRDGIRS